MTKSSVRRHLIAGMVVIAPVTATGFLLWWIFQVLDGLLGRFLYPALAWMVPGQQERIVIPGLGLIALFLLLVGTGWLAERTIGSRIVNWWHSTLERIPLTRRIYSAANRIVRAVFSENSRPFNQVVLIEYPAAGRWAIAFLSASVPEVMHSQVHDGVAVFMPTTPNPTTGFLVLLPRSHVHAIDMSVDEAFTYILSAGSVRPDNIELPPNLAVPPMAPAPIERMS
jgi:uncharacterized membrane protein